MLLVYELEFIAQVQCTLSINLQSNSHVGDNSTPRKLTRTVGIRQAGGEQQTNETGFRIPGVQNRTSSKHMHAIYIYIYIYIMCLFILIHLVFFLYL